MKKRILMTSLALVLALAIAIPMALPVAAYSFPSTNQLNKDQLVPGREGQLAPYVDLVQAGVGYVDLSFVGGYAGGAWFEYRIDGTVKTSGNPHPVVIGDYIYPNIGVAANTIVPITISATVKVEIRLALGGERDWDFDWTTFYVLPDVEGPITSNVVASPNLVEVGASVTLTANIDDTTTGGSNIASAEYSLDGGTNWFSMDASDGIFNEVSEDVEATFNADSEAGIYTYNLCVRGTDVFDNTGTEECTELMLVVYDPSAGFVTGGGWIDSPPGAYMPSDSTVVTEANVGVDWFTNDTRPDGYAAFVDGPGIPPLGSGSLEMGTTAGQDKAQLFNYDHMGTLLADIESITYATYRDSSSTNPPAQYPAINIEVDYVGDGSTYTTLVWEPIYAYGQSNLALDTWQTWDTMAPSQTGFQGGWWSTQDMSGVLAGAYVDWNTIVTNNPNAKIKYGFGVNIGSGWNGIFTGAVDALSLRVNDDTTTYDFESVAPPTGKASFGFVAKYKKGASVPDGQTQFMFQTADLNFHSNSYEWLVVTGSDYAKFKGSGTINGMGDYKFMLWAGDSDPDTFRIKIWYEIDDTEIVVYDNGMNLPIGGGNIVVHTSKK